MPINSFENYPLTWKPDKKQLFSPYYLSIASRLEYDIINGYLAPNTKLPPQRELADFLDINLSTITRAFKICESKGLIYGIIGSGTFVAPNAGNSICIAANESYKSYIEMGIIKPLDCSNILVTEAIKSVAGKNYLEKLLDYGNPLGIPYHKTAAQKWLRCFGMEVPTNNIAITSGGQNSLTLLLISLFHPGDKIAVDTYIYPNFIELSKMLNIRLLPIPNDELGMLPEQLDIACRKNKLQGIYLNPSCNNPTAISMNMERRKAIADVIRKHKLILLEDDTYSFLAPPDILPISHFVPDQYIYILSASKSLSSGLRIGFIAYANHFSEKIVRGIFNINIKTSALNAEIVTELINTGIAGRIISEKKEIANERNLIYRQYFEIQNQYENPLSFFRWYPLQQSYLAKQFEQDAINLGIHIYHSSRFLVGKNEDAQFIRISLSSATDSTELENGLSLLKSFLLLKEQQH